MDEESEDLAQLGFLSRSNLLSGRLSGFTEREKGIVAQYAKEFIENGKHAIVVSFGKEKEIYDPLILFRASEIAELHGLIGVNIFHDILFGKDNSVDYREILSAYYKLKKLYKEFVKEMKGGK